MAIHRLHPQQASRLRGQSIIIDARGFFHTAKQKRSHAGTGPNFSFARPQTIDSYAVHFEDGVRPIFKTEVIKGLGIDYFYCASPEGPIVIHSDLVASNAKGVYDNYIQDAKARIAENSKTRGLDGKYAELFEMAASYAITIDGSLHAIRQYAFMLDQIAKSGGTFHTATTTMLHNLNDKQITAFMAQIKNGKAKLAAEVYATLRRFKKLEAVQYDPDPNGMYRFQIQNFMDSLICICEGDGDAMLLRLVCKLTKLCVEEKADAQTIKAARELFAPLCDRFGLIDLYIAILDNSFRLEASNNKALELAKNPKADPVNDYQKALEEIIITLGCTTLEEAQTMMNKFEHKLNREFGKHFGDFALSHRIKSVFSTVEKTHRKPEEYPTILDQRDIGGFRITMPKLPKHFETVQAYVQQAFGHDFDGFNLERNKAGVCQTAKDTRKMEISGKSVTFYYFSVKLKNGAFIEVQVISEEDEKVLKYEEAAHWAYKLQSSTNQKFDKRALNGYGGRMAGDFFDDVKSVYEYIQSRWIYTFVIGKSRHMSVYRLKKGSGPLDQAALVLHGDMHKYSQCRKTKIWKRQIPAPAILDSKQLETGDLIEVETLVPRRNREDLRKKTIYAKSLLTRYSIFLISDEVSEYIMRQVLRDDRAKRLGIQLLREECRKRSHPYKLSEVEEVAANNDSTPDNLFRLLALRNSDLLTPHGVVEEILALCA